MKGSQLVLVAALLLPLPQASAQRTDDGRAGMPPVHRDSTRPSREAVFVRRAAQSGVAALITAVPFAVVALRQDDRTPESVLLTGSLAYVTAATLGAARRSSMTCGFGERVWRAAGGALAGIAAPTMFWHIAEDGADYNAHHFNDNRGRMTAAGFLLGAPLGAAAALYNCR